MRCTICYRRLPGGAACPGHPHVISPAETPITGPAPAIDGFDVLRPLGKGGFATVFLAATRGDPAASEVAIKVSHERVDLRLMREAEILERLARRDDAASPSAWPIPRYFGHGKSEDGFPYVAMEFVPAELLAQRLAQRTLEPTAESRVHDPAERVSAAATDLRRVEREFVAVCRAVEIMHANDVVHRDLKPENILLRPDDSAVLIDFGLARLASLPDNLPEVHVTQTSERVGTYHYMAPEQWMGNIQTDKRTDIYALGVIAYEMLVGVPPFVGSPIEVRHGHVSGRCPRVSEQSDNLPGDLDEVLLRCLAKSKDRRYAQISELILDFQIACRSTRRAPARPTLERTRAAAEKHLVALLSIHTEAPAPVVAGWVVQHGAAILATDDDHYVLAFPWAPSIVAGVRCALEMVDDPPFEFAGTQIVHVAEARMRRRRSGVRLSGKDVSAPWTWADSVTSGRDAGSLLTNAAARVLEPGDTQRVSDGFYELKRADQAELALPELDPHHISLRGRDPLLRPLVDEVGDALDLGVPIVVTLDGAAGMGKTRVLHALAIGLRGEQARRVAYFRAAAGRQARSESLVCQLLREALSLPRACEMADIDRAWAQLGATPSEPGRWITAYLLEAIPDDAPELAPILGTPGAQRHAAARALALALTHAAAAQPLCVLIDDVHLADQTVLDGLEMASLGDPARPVSLAVCVTARPVFAETRENWGDRALSARRVSLDPLAPDDAKSLLLELLHPVEYVPDTVLDRLYEMTSGTPLYLVELALNARRSGAIRPYPAPKEGYFLATDELLRTADAPIDEHLARQTVDGLPADLVPLAQLCAVLGQFTQDEVSGVQSLLREEAASAIETDVAAGLMQLAAQGLIEQTATGYAVCHEVLARALAAQTPTTRRADFHSAIVQHWQHTGAPPTERMARHAAHAGDTQAACRLYLQVADESLARNEYVDAERQYDLALEHLPEDHPERYRALFGRGRMRLRLQRLEDALDDLRSAAAQAQALGNVEGEVECLLGQAMVLDFLRDWKQSARVAQEAATKAKNLDSTRLRAALDLARGRAHWRRQEFGDAEPALTRAASGAVATGDHETHIVSLMLLMYVHMFSEQYDNAETSSQELIQLCKRTGDDFHLGFTYSNRLFLWHKLGDIDRARADCEAAIALSRQLGLARLARVATYNLSENLYAANALEEALMWVDRSCELHRRFGDMHARFQCELLKAKILCSLAHADVHDQVRVLDELLDGGPPQTDASSYWLVKTAASSLDRREFEQEAWLALAEASHPDLVEIEDPQVVIETALIATEVACHLQKAPLAEFWHERAREATRGESLWEPRLSALASRVRAI